MRLDGGRLEVGESFENLIARATVHDSELAFLLLSETPSLTVESVARSRVGPLYAAGMDGPSALQPILERHPGRAGSGAAHRPHGDRRPPRLERRPVRRRLPRVPPPRGPGAGRGAAPSSRLPGAASAEAGLYLGHRAGAPRFPGKEGLSMPGVHPGIEAIRVRAADWADAPTARDSAAGCRVREGPAFPDDLIPRAIRRAGAGGGRPTHRAAAPGPRSRASRGSGSPTRSPPRRSRRSRCWRCLPGPDRCRRRSRPPC